MSSRPFWAKKCNMQCTRCKASSAKHAIDKAGLCPACVQRSQTGRASNHDGASHADRGGGPELIQDEVLAYIDHYSQKNPVDSIKIVLQEGCSLENITKARKYLLDICDKLGCRPSHITTDRKDSPARSAQVISLDDIMEMWSIIDQKSYPVVFYAKNFDIVPKVEPDKVTNMMSINARMAQMEMAMQQLQTVVETQTEVVTKLTTKLAPNENNTPYRDAAVRNIPASDTRQQIQDVTVTVNDSEVQVLSAAAPSRSIPGVPSRAPGGNINRATPRLRRGSYRGDGAKSAPSASAPNMATFGAPSQRQAKKWGYKAVYGTKKNDTGMAAGEDGIDIFVFKVNKEFNEDSVRNYMEENGVTAKSIECKSHQDALNKSFKVRILRKDADKVINSEFWPENIGCRMFRKQRKWNEDNGNQERVST